MNGMVGFGIAQESFQIVYDGRSPFPLGEGFYTLNLAGLFSIQGDVLSRVATCHETTLVYPTNRLHFYIHLCLRGSGQGYIHNLWRSRV